MKAHGYTDDMRATLNAAEILTVMVVAAKGPMILTCGFIVNGSNSQMEKTGIQSLHARTHLGFDLKAWASLLALVFSNIID